MSLESRVEAVFGSGTSLALATSAIDELLAGESQEPLLAFISKLVANACTDSRMPSHIARPAMMHLARGVKALSGAALETAATHMLAALKAQSVAFDEAEFVLRDALFEYLVSTGEYAEAAAVLAAVNLESTSRVFSDAEKVDILVKISEVYLEDRDHVEKAETFVSKAAPIMNSIADVALQLRYRTTSARVLDLNRKFVDAAQRFYELSTMTTANIEAGDLLELLGKALTCAVLGRVGAQRTRVMALLSKDPRLEQLSDLPLYASHAAVLLKMFNEQILMHSELLAFEASLMPHQKSLTADGFSLAHKAVVEHNIVAIGRIYSNIYISELAHLLHMDAATAERVATKMITEERLKAIVDQSAGVLLFDDAQGAGKGAELDDRVRQLCADITDCETYVLSLQAAQAMA